MHRSRPRNARIICQPVRQMPQNEKQHQKGAEKKGDGFYIFSKCDEYSGEYQNCAGEVDQYIQVRCRLDRNRQHNRPEPGICELQEANAGNAQSIEDFGNGFQLIHYSDHFALWDYFIKCSCSSQPYEMT